MEIVRNGTEFACKVGVKPDHDSRNSASVRCFLGSLMPDKERALVSPPPSTLRTSSVLMVKARWSLANVVTSVKW